MDRIEENSGTVQGQTEVSRSNKIRTEIDEQGRSWAVIDDLDMDRFLDNSMEWMGGYPDTWKRR